MSTIYEVAKMANVSRTTVSRYINQNGYVSAETMGRIQKAIQALHFHPNRMAQGLNSNTSKNIALVVGDIKNPMIAYYVRSIETVAFVNDYNIVICDTDFELCKEIQYIRMLVDKCIDGIIIAPCGQGKEHLEEVVERNIPMVYITRSNPYITADSVLFESINGSFNIVQYLIQKGHKRIGMLCRTIDLENPKERLEGYKRALEENRLFVDPELIVCEKTGVGGQSYGMEKLMHLSHPPTAVYASINAQAQGAFRYCRAHGLFIPEDVELACFESFPDEDPIRNRPRWVANELPFAQLGAIATRLLFERVMQKVKTPPRHIVLEGKMRIPESAESG